MHRHLRQYFVAALDRWKPGHVVVDPVRVATSGAKLLSRDATGLLREALIPRAGVRAGFGPGRPESSAADSTSVPGVQGKGMRKTREKLPARDPGTEGPRLEHDPEKCEAVFRKDHAQTQKAEVT